MNQHMENQTAQALDTFSAITLRCFGICVLILLAWFIWSITALDFGYQFYNAWFGITHQQFALANLIVMAGFKVLGVTFFLIPWLAVQLLARKRTKEANTH